MNQKNNIESSTNPLANYLPEGTFELILPLIDSLPLKIRITNSRKTKFGDFRASLTNNMHQITVNGDLNKYHFLITFLHELAHLKTWEEYKNKAKPHGQEWKEHFKSLLVYFINKKIFPVDLSIAISYHLKSIKASSSSDLKLTTALRKYDENTELVIEDIPHNSLFKIPDGRVFRKGEKRRTRYKCLCMSNKKEYLFSPFCQIEPFD